MPIIYSIFKEMGSIKSLNRKNDLEEAHSHWNRDQKIGVRPYLTLPPTHKPTGFVNDFQKLYLPDGFFSISFGLSAHPQLDCELRPGQQVVEVARVSLKSQRKQRQGISGTIETLVWQTSYQSALASHSSSNSRIL